MAPRIRHKKRVLQTIICGDNLQVIFLFMERAALPPVFYPQDCFACCKIDGMKYKTLRSIVRFIMNIIADVEVHGIEKLPEGNVIVAANHLGRLDTARLLYILDREAIIMAVATQNKTQPLHV